MDLKLNDQQLDERHVDAGCDVAPNSMAARVESRTYVSVGREDMLSPAPQEHERTAFVCVVAGNGGHITNIQPFTR
jgi:hypothetical protein